jgi:hypothetical protein
MNKRMITRLTAVCVAAFLLSACGGSSKNKRGCTSTSANMGAERLLSGEKPEKKGKYKIKGMN